METGGGGVPLPIEIWGMIMAYFNTRQLRQMSLVCKNWRTMILSPLLWESKGIMHPSQTKDVPTKVHLVRNLQGHSNVVFCLTIWEGLLFSGGYDYALRGWNEKGEQVKQLEEHSNMIFGLTVWRNQLISGDYGNVMVQRQPNDGTVTKLDHTATVYHIVPWDDNVVTASFDGLLRLWRPNHEGILELAAKGTGHTQQVQCLYLWNERLYSGSWDGTVRLWNSDLVCEKVFCQPTHGGESKVRCMLVWNDLLYAGYSNGSICSYNSDGKQIQHLSGHAGEVHCLSVWHGLLFSGDWSGQIRAWDDAGKCVLLIPSSGASSPEPAITSTEHAHSQAITCMKVWNDMLYTGSYDYSIKAWGWKENK